MADVKDNTSDKGTSRICPRRSLPLAVATELGMRERRSRIGSKLEESGMEESGTFRERAEWLIGSEGRVKGSDVSPEEAGDLAEAEE